MSKPKFTSWHVEKCGGRIEINMGDYSIALRDSTENMELAAFIAAAPDMYEFLRYLCASRSNGICDCEDGECDECSINRILKKARGEE